MCEDKRDYFECGCEYIAAESPRPTEDSEDVAERIAGGEDHPPCQSHALEDEGAQGAGLIKPTLPGFCPRCIKDEEFKALFWEWKKRTKKKQLEKIWGYFASELQKLQASDLASLNGQMDEIFENCHQRDWPEHVDAFIKNVCKDHPELNKEALQGEAATILKPEEMMAWNP